MIIVIGYPHHNTLGIVRCFGRGGHNVTLILRCCENDFLSCSRYVAQSYYAITEEELIDILLNKINHSDSDNVIISCDDYTAMELDIHLYELLPYYRFFSCGDQGALTKMMDKVVQCKLAEHAGLCTPKTWSCLPHELVTLEMSYPIIARPLESIHGGKNIVVCHSANDLAEAASAFHAEDRIIVQEFLQRESEIVVLGVACNGEVCIPGYIFKHREVKGGTTYSTVHPVDEIAYLIPAAKHLVELMHYEGLFGIELLYANGRYYFIEINLRADATTYALAEAGANLPVSFAERKVGESAASVSTINSIVEFADLPLLLKRKVSVREWISNLKDSKCRYYYNKCDKKPYYVGMWQFFKRLTKRTLILK